MSRRTLPVLAALLFVGAAHSTAYAQAAPNSSGSGAATYNAVQDTPRDWYAYNPCQQEAVHLTATQHVVRSIVRNGTSTLSVYHLSYSDGRAVGVTTGLTYFLSGEAQQVTLAESAGSSSDFIINNRLDGQGTTPDMWLHQVKTATWDGTTDTISTKADTLVCR